MIIEVDDKMRKGKPRHNPDKPVNNLRSLSV